MDALSPETRREIVRRVFPELRYGGDPDLERYFELRRAGRLAEALALYNGPLRARYPVDSERVLLLRLYREGDPRWPELQDRLILARGEALAQRISRDIDLIVAPLERAELSSAFKALAAVQALLCILPRGQDAALAALERYADFARILRHRARQVERARDLVREYLEMSRASEPDETDFVARSAALEERRRAAADGRRAQAGSGGASTTESYDFIAMSEAREARKRKEEEEARARFFDLSRLEFSAADRARIEADAGIERKEDRVLAFCFRYWRAVDDPAFERLVFLYSKKYGTRHYAIFRAIKVGRARRFTDDEILTAVSTLISSAYSYSVQGDLYMQAAWRRLKAGIEEAERARAEALALAEIGRGRAPRSRSDAAHAPHNVAPHRPSAEATARSETKRTEATLRGAQRRPPRAQSGARAAARKTEAAAPTAKKRLAPRETAKGGTKTAHPRPSIVQARRAPEALPELRTPRGSVSDRIRALSGKAYDVYKELFLERSRDAIRRVILASRTGPRRLFDTSANEAEDIVYGFMTAHYNDPFMDWEGSEERSRVASLGFELPSLDPVIETWFRSL